MNQRAIQWPQLRSVLVAIGVALSSYILGNGLILAVTITLMAAGVSVFDRPAILLFLSVVLLQGVTFGGVALGYLKLRGLGWSFIRVRTPTLRDLAVTVGGFLFVMAILIGISGILSYFGIQSAQNQVINTGYQTPVLFLLLIPLSFLLVGPGEELLFRGLIQGRLAESFQSSVAIVLASALFAVIHIGSLSGQGKLVYILLVFGLALILGASYEYTDNLAVPALIHGGYNAVQFGGAYLAATAAL